MKSTRQNRQTLQADSTRYRCLAKPAQEATDNSLPGYSGKSGTEQHRVSGLSIAEPFRSRMGLVLLLLCAYGCFSLLEVFTHQPWGMPFIQQLFNIGFFALMILLWLGVTGRGWVAALISVLLSAGIGYANYVVIAFRDKPILPYDLLSLQTAMSVSTNYELPVPANVWLLLLIAAAVIGVCSFARIRLAGIRLRLVITVCCILLLAGFTGVLQSSRFTRFFYFNETLFTPGYLYQQNGFVPSFLIHLRYLRVDEPHGYSLDEVEELAEAITEKAEDENNLVENSLKDAPNLLVIMNETFSDPAVISAFTASQDYMPFTRSLRDNTVRGDLFVSVIGGNTATTEFEFLTGDTMAFLPNGCVAYQQYIHHEHPSLPTLLKELGYSTLAMHPFGRDGWDRDEVYDLFSFDQAMFLDDFTERELIRQYVSDRSVYRQMLKALEQKKATERLFSFAVTMQNHGGYDLSFDNFEPSVKILEPDADFSQTEMYVSLIRESDKALEELINTVKAMDERTMILFFGDHQPHDHSVAGLLAQNSYQYDEIGMLQARHTVPFLIWANYDIAEQEGLGISANYLSTLLLETAGLPLSSYGLFLSDLRQDIPVITANFYQDANGRTWTFDKASPAVQDRLQAYEILQYNHLIDWENRLARLFVPVTAAH